jgi:hypothetical protein
MNTKIDKNTDGKKEKPVYNQCIGCRRGCSMSGMCMRQWPEFVDKKAKRGIDDPKNT